MQVTLMVADSLVRHPLEVREDGSHIPSPRLPKVVMTYQDRRSTSVAEALDAAWRICNAAPSKLTEAEARLRDVWDARAGGAALSVGDVVEVDGESWRCTPEGWEPA